jgi:hypothetical protein
MGPHLVVLSAPALDEDLGLQQGVKALPVEALVAQLAVEGLHIAVLPRTAGRDEEGRDAHTVEPLADDGGGELGAVIGAQVDWRAPLDEELG